MTTTTPQPLWLALDTATENLGLALVGRVNAAHSEVVWRGLSARLHPALAELLANHQVAWADLSGIVVNLGPGSFTSIRIGLATARGLALPLSTPILGVDGFRVMAAPLSGQPVGVWFTAVGDEVYFQYFDAAGAALTEPAVGPAPEALGQCPAGTVLVGNAVAHHAALLATRPDITPRPELRYPDPQVLGQLALAGQASPSLKPLYLRALQYRKLTAS